jgi:hypothetical protein
MRSQRLGQGKLGRGRPQEVLSWCLLTHKIMWDLQLFDNRFPPPTKLKKMLPANRGYLVTE